jgi:hypothetical protein
MPGGWHEPKAKIYLFWACLALAVPHPGGGEVSAGTGARRRARRANAEAHWRAYHLRQRADLQDALEESRTCFYAVNLREAG